MKLRSLTKKSILGLNTVKAFIIVLLSLAIIGIVTLVVLGSIQNANINPAGSANANATAQGWTSSTSNPCGTNGCSGQADAYENQY